MSSYAADVAPTLTVSGLPGGNTLGVPTLDLCNGDYPSEAQRTARLQVAAVDRQGDTAMSTEAVLYSSGAGTAAAFSQLKTAAAACPDKPVDSPVGQPTVTTKFGPAPDGAWPQVPGVERLAFEFDSISTRRWPQSTAWSTSANTEWGSERPWKIRAAGRRVR